MTPFTPRQLQIVRGIASGLLRKEVAEILGISISTVNTHMENIGRKLNLCGGPKDLAAACTHYALAFGQVENQYLKVKT